MINMPKPSHHNPYPGLTTWISWVQPIRSWRISDESRWGKHEPKFSSNYHKAFKNRTLEEVLKDPGAMHLFLKSFKWETVCDKQRSSEFSTKNVEKLVVSCSGWTSAMYRLSWTHIPKRCHLTSYFIYCSGVSEPTITSLVSTLTRDAMVCFVSCSFKWTLILRTIVSSSMKLL